MDFALLIISFIFMIIGLFGSFLPILPGPSISWIGLLILNLTSAVTINYWLLGITLIVTITISILDYIIPAKGTKLFGGTSYGIWGTNIGLVIGIFTPIPFGFLIGPFLGALIGELIYNYKDRNRALKAAIGSFLGLLASSFMAFIICVMYFGLYIWMIWQYKTQLF